MAGNSPNSIIHDALYGRVRFEEPLASLVRTPIVQRLRHVRLSNIDSLDMPGIANLSRYEHVLGVAHLATLVGFRNALPYIERVALEAAALLHDWAITSFGHLVEEAFQYVGAQFHHEARLAELAIGESDADIGGIRYRQILEGRENGLSTWIEKVVPRPAERRALMEGISASIQGCGRYGKVIAGTIDLDNIDNVSRMAFHMGILPDKALPARLAQSVIDVVEGDILFSSGSLVDIREWLKIRRAVYDRLMLSERDFAGKLMLLYATSEAFVQREINESDWSLTDDDFMSRLRRSPSKKVSETARRWYVGELWDTSPLMWMSGPRPKYTDLFDFSKELSEIVGRESFAYGISDKRDRQLRIRLAGDGQHVVGDDAAAKQWLLGFGSPVRQPWSRKDIGQALDLAARRFGSRMIASASVEGADELAWLN